MFGVGKHEMKNNKHKKKPLPVIKTAFLVGFTFSVDRLGNRTTYTHTPNKIVQPITKYPRKNDTRIKINPHIPNTEVSPITAEIQLCQYNDIDGYLLNTRHRFFVRSVNRLSGKIKPGMT